MKKKNKKVKLVKKEISKEIYDLECSSYGMNLELGNNSEVSSEKNIESNAKNDNKEKRTIRRLFLTGTGLMILGGLGVYLTSKYILPDKPRLLLGAASVGLIGLGAFQWGHLPNDNNYTNQDDEDDYYDEFVTNVSIGNLEDAYRKHYGNDKITLPRIHGQSYPSYTAYNSMKEQFEKANSNNGPTLSKK